VRDYLVLQVGVEIDEDVAAGDQVQACEGWVADDAMGREDTGCAQFFEHEIAGVVSREIGLEALG